MQKRPPIIAIMGHVDHGKTTLLDHIRKTRVAEKEAGGITQSVGAYAIQHNEHAITFIDTPGHEAFANMRAHSAKIADLAILVVAADDGVKPQTLNALHFINEEKIPFVVALNKIDKPNADIEKAKQSLLTAGVYLEGMGGNVPFHEISAKTGTGVSELLDLVLLLADMEKLEADPLAPASGIVLTSKSDPQKGIAVGVIVKNGTLKFGELIATTSAKGKIKMLFDAFGKSAKTFPPASPALIIGFETLPMVGEEFFAGETAFEFCKGAVSASERDEIPENVVPLILKAEESGSLEALQALVCKLQEKEKHEVVILSATVGDIYENDIRLAKSSGATILAFKSKIDKAAQNVITNEAIPVIVSDIIYELETALIKRFSGMDAASMRSFEIIRVFGEAKGREQVIGGKVTRGDVVNQDSFEVWKGEKKIGTGKILNLQSGKEDVKTVDAGNEAGMLVESGISLVAGMELRFINS
jgi:translation initiation factor IF-2